MDWKLGFSVVFSGDVKSIESAISQALKGLHTSKAGDLLSGGVDPDALQVAISYEHNPDDAFLTDWQVEALCKSVSVLRRQFDFSGVQF